MSAERKRRRRFLRDERGATALEFALLGPPFLMLLFGLFHFGWAMHCASTVRYAAEQAARSLALNADTDEAAIRASIIAQLTTMADPELTVKVTKDRTTPGLQIADVVTDYEHRILSPFLPDYTVNFHNEVRIATPLLS